MNTIKTAVILAGGRGTRLSEQTHKIPKPLVELHGKPILLHIMEKLVNDGIEKFYILGGYKIEEIYNYFLSNINISNNKLIFSSALAGLEMTNKLAFLKDIEVQIFTRHGMVGVKGNSGSVIFNDRCSDGIAVGCTKCYLLTGNELF